MKGDIVFVEREPLWFGDIKHRLHNRSSWADKLIARFFYYKHYGIEIEDEKIIHFYCPSILKLNEGNIAIVDKSQFLKKNGILKVDKNINYKYSRDEVVLRAKALLNTDFNGYSIINNNCEHFAIWCCTGKKDVQQVPFYSKYNVFINSLRGKIISALNKNIWN